MEGKPASAHEICEAAVDEVLATVNTVQYVIKSIEEITSTPFLRERIKCVSGVHSGSGNDNGGGGFADGSSAAGYLWRRMDEHCDKGDILLVEEHIVPEKTGAAPIMVPDKKILAAVERNLRHELIHAFDDARGVVEASDCTHQACSEIRAARLSGDCFVGQELSRGRLDFFRGGMQCVRRRAVLAVDKNPICRSFSERAVELVFKRCYSDYEPFAAPLYSMGSYGDENLRP